MLVGAVGLVSVLVVYPAVSAAQTTQKGTTNRRDAAVELSAPRDLNPKDGAHEFSWERPGTVSIFDLQFGAAEFKDGQVQLVDNSRTFSAGQSGDRLILMVRFSYRASRREIPLKFVIRLPEARQYEETVRLPNMNGQYVFHFTIQRPGDFLGTGFVYLYYGFSIVDVLDFTIMPGS
jgi:hypothetical protein